MTGVDVPFRLSRIARLVSSLLSQSRMTSGWSVSVAVIVEGSSLQTVA